MAIVVFTNEEVIVKHINCSLPGICDKENNRPTLAIFYDSKKEAELPWLTFAARNVSNGKYVNLTKNILDQKE